jgi:predicted KAP-like P-loop ATPase
LLKYELKERQNTSERIKSLLEEQRQLENEIKEKKENIILFKESIGKLVTTSEPLQVKFENLNF